MKRQRYIWLFLMAVLFTSCANDEYVDVIPAESIALLSIDWQQAENAEQQQAGGQILKVLLQTDGIDDSGLALNEKVYLFETTDGVFGLCAKVDSRKKLIHLFEERLLSDGRCKEFIERRGYRFTVLDDNWAVGFSDEALLVMGPVVGGAELAHLQQRMAKYLDAEDNKSIRNTALFERLEALTAPICMVVQAEALPESVAMPLTIGAPKEADASQLWLSAEMKNIDGCLEITGNTFSFNAKIDDALKVSHEVFRPVTEKFVSKMSQKALFGLFLNSEGQQLLPMLQANKGVQMLLAGMNTAIDMDNILRSVDGNVAVIVSGYEREKPQVGMLAELAHANWLKDVDYWKHSCPKGTAIRDNGEHAFILDLDVSHGGTDLFPFGVTADKLFYGGRFQQGEETSGVPMVKEPLPSAVQSKIVGKKLSLVLTMEALQAQMSGEAYNIVKSVMKPFFGEVTTIIYTMK